MKFVVGSEAKNTQI